jgi:hypothetical protein
MKKTIIALTCLVSLLTVVPARAENPDESAPVAVEAEAIEVQAVDTAAEEERAETPAADVKVNYAALESAGTLTNVREGALGKSLWQNQNRSDIVMMLDRMPLSTAMMSVTALKKGVLLSQNDASTIKNDIMPKPGYDLMTLRLYKLMDSGLYGDAYDLYTQSVDDPYDESLARVGILLHLFKADLATACLEEKVQASRFPGVEFWEMIDAACNLEMSGTTTSKALDKSAVINAIFAQPGYKVPADDQGTLLKMTRFERAMVLAQGRLDYAAMIKDPKRGLQADAALLMMYVNDPTLPPALLLPLQKEAISRGLLLPNILKKSDPEYKRISTVETPAEKARALEELLTKETNIAAIIPYAVMIRENEELKLSAVQSRKALSALILSGEEIPQAYIDRLTAESSQKPENYVYLQTLVSLGRADKSVNIPVDKLVLGVNALGLKKSGQLLAIIENLDKDKKLNDNPARVYEKQLGLTSDGYYVMPSLGLTEWLETAQTQQLTGLTVLIALTMLPDAPGTIYAGTLRDAVEGLQAVGLIESANKIMEEVLVTAINDNKGE